MNDTKSRAYQWAKLSLAGLAGFCLGGGCTVQGLDAVIIGIDAAADQLRDDDDDDFSDWLEDRWDDREDFWDHVF